MTSFAAFPTPAVRGDLHSPIPSSLEPAPPWVCHSPDRQRGCSSERHDIGARAVQSGDWGRQEDGREEAATTGGEHGQHPLFTGDTYHITEKAGGQES